MSLYYKLDGTQDAETTLEFLVRDGSSGGKVSLFSNLVNTVNIQVFNGIGYTAYTVATEATVLDSETNVAVIQAAGNFRVVIPASTPIAMYVSIHTNLKPISGFS
jgi:hypothetical protein